MFDLYKWLLLGWFLLCLYYSMSSITALAGLFIDTRNMKIALLRALLDPTAELRKLEAAGDYTARLALLEEQKSLPWQAV
ncbi:L-rhamnose isomerase, partial [Escherichia coli]|uniref:L-rhamnose isomerase n=1 Tax=Escherichia coli TaxID=562 RepID=UPI0024E10712